MKLLREVTVNSGPRSGMILREYTEIGSEHVEALIDAHGSKNAVKKNNGNIQIYVPNTEKAKPIVGDISVSFSETRDAIVEEPVKEKAPEENSFPCEHCDKVFGTSRAVKIHQKRFCRGISRG